MIHLTEQWTVQWHMKSLAWDNPYICALCNQELISRCYLQRHMKGRAINNQYPCALCLKECISINHPKRQINRNSGKFQIAVFCNIQENDLQEYDLQEFFLMQLLQEIFSFGNVISRQKTSWEYPATQNLQHKIVCCWWKHVINYLCSTDFV